MEIEFKTKKLKKVCEDSKKLSQKFGSHKAGQIIKRINELISAKNLYDISKLPQANLHLLKGNLKNHFAVNLNQPYRLIFLPLNGDLLDLKSITSVKIINIKDYH